MELATVTLLAALSAAGAAAETPVTLTRGVIVRAERMICRPVTRTGTRIGTNALCRTPEETARAGQYKTLEEAEAKLEVISNPCGCNQ